MSELMVADLTARQKAAIVVMSLGAEAAPLLGNLDEGVVEELAEEMVRLGDVPPAVTDAVLTEFHNRLASNNEAGGAGIERASRILEARLGMEGATQVVQRIGWRANSKLTTFARHDPKALAEVIAIEHPQTLAFLMTQIDQDVAGRVIAALPEEVQQELAWRIATMREINPLHAAVVHQALAPLVDPQTGAKKTERLGGEQKTAGLLNMVPATSQKAVLAEMEARDPELAARVRKLMFVFRDLLLLDDRSMQRVLKEVDVKDLSLALRNADEDVKQKVFKNVSERAAVGIREEMEYMGRVKAKDVEEARDRIIEVVRSLEEKGEVEIDRGGSADDAV